MNIDLGQLTQKTYETTYGKIFGSLSFLGGEDQINEITNNAGAIASSSLAVLKYIAVLAVVILIGFFVWLFLKSGREAKEKVVHLARSINPPEIASGPIKARWEEIERHLNSYRDAEWKFAIIEADKLVEDVLGKAGFKGETMADKLKSITTYQLSCLSGLWDAHKLRNLLVHNTEFDLKHNEVRYAIDQYAKVLKELNVL